MEPEATINTYTFYEKYIVCLRRKLFSIIKEKIVRYKSVWIGNFYFAIGIPFYF